MNKNILLLFFLWATTSLPTLYAQLDRGPYLQLSTPNSIYIKWRTESPTESIVWYGSSPNNLNYTAQSPGTTTEHEVQLTGLSTYTTYYYAVGDDSGILQGADNEHHFKTHPSPGSNTPFRAWIQGDVGTGTPHQRNTRDAFFQYLGSQEIDLMLLLGDNAYDNGKQHEYQDAIFEDMYENLINKVTLWPTFGNHDGSSSHSNNQTGPYYDIFTLPTHAEAGGYPSGTEAYYSYDYANVHFIALNSYDVDLSPNGEMAQWLQNDLQTTNQDWIIAYFHHPIYSGAHNNETDNATHEKAMRENILPILEAHNIDLVLFGHTHNYQRSFLIKGHYGKSNTFDPNTMLVDGSSGSILEGTPYSKLNEDGGAVFVCMGNAAKLEEESEEDLQHPTTYIGRDIRGSVELLVNGDQLDFRFILQDGTIEDQFTILKSINPLSVNITNPTNNSYYPNLQYIPIQVEASDENGSVQKVDFFVNDVYIGTDYSSPYSAYWHPLVAGSYYVDVKATDNEGFVKYDHVQFQVGQTITHCTQIIQSSDDAEQRQNGSINLTSGDIELIEDNNKDQIVGLRFTGLNIPHGAAISKAHLQFEVKDNTNENPCVLNIYGQKGSNPLTFSSNPNDISNRTKTDNYATWSPPTWNNNDPPRSSSNLQEVLQEIVMQDEYNPDQAIVLIIEGIGARNAISFDQGNGSKAPLLCVTFDADNCYDTDFDGTCDIDDICLPGPEPGQPCNDGDSSTSNDAINNDCECVGIHYDCPDLQMQFGNPCDDNNPYTCQDIITFNCDCVGIPTNGDLVLSIPILHDNHDAEERSNGSVSTSSSDLELVKDNSTQVVGLFFQNPGVPAGTELTEAFVQFTVDEKKNSNPCVLTIFGELNSNASAFASSTYNISDRNKTNASITWSPDNWDSVNDQGADQRTPNIAPILQEIINRNGYSPNTPFVLIIEGSGKRVAFSHDKDPDKAPVLSIAFENNITEDSDGDGICDEEDLCFGANPGTPCNDNNPATYEDMIDNDCNCTGTPYDCPELLANIGDSCDDGDPLTFNDVLYADCACAGSSLVPVEICSRVSKKQDDAEEKSNGNCSTTSSDLELVDDKGNNQLVGVRFRNIHLPQGTTIESAYLQFTVDALNDEDPCELIIHGELAPNPAVFKKKKHNISDRDLTNASVQWSPEAWTNVGDDGPAQRSTDIGSIIQEIVNQEGFDEDSPIVLILSGEGTREAESREGGANKAPELCVTLLMPPNTEAIASNNLGLAEDTPRDRQSAGNVAGAHLAKASTKYTDHKPLASFLDIHPNPASSELKAIFDMNAPTEAFISILDINGYMLSQKKYAVIAGTNRVTMDIANLPNGLYFITLQTNAERRIAKFSILHQNQ